MILPGERLAEHAARTSTKGCRTPSVLFLPCLNAGFYHVKSLRAEELSARHGNGLCDLIGCGNLSSSQP